MNRPLSPIPHKVNSTLRVLAAALIVLASTRSAANVDTPTNWEDRLSWGEERQGVRLGCATFFTVHNPQEHVLLRYRVVNQTDGNLYWDPEGSIEQDNKPGEDRPHSVLRLWGPDGEPIKSDWEPETCERGMSVTLGPKRSHDGTILIDKYFDFDKPGEYRVVLELSPQVSQKGAGRTTVTVSSAPGAFSISTTERDKIERNDEDEVYKWMTVWDSCFGVEIENANRALIAMGPPAVPILFDRLTARDYYAAQSWKVLTGMEAADAMVIPRAKQIASDRSLDPKDDKDWRSFRAGGVRLGPPPRFDAIDYLVTRSGADEEIIPFLTNLIEDKTETESVRIRSIEAIGTLGEKGLSLLQAYVDSEEDPIRESARKAVAAIHSDRGGREAYKKYFGDLVLNDPFDPHVPEYLIQIKRMLGPSKRIQPATQKVKERIRNRLSQDPNPEIAWMLAEIIQDQIRSTDLGWGKVNRFGQLKRNREDPSENFESLEDALRIAYTKSEPGSELARKSGCALARLYILKGDWELMNRVLSEIGSDRVEQEDIPWLAPPKPIEAATSEIWRTCDEEMRAGNCGLVVRVVDDRGGVKGAQVIVRRPDPPEREGPTGGMRPAINPFHWSEVVPGRYSDVFFRHLGTDARFGVTDDSGTVKFEKLPKIPVEIDVLVPNGLLPKGWGGGELEVEGRPSRFELKEGETVEYPTLRVKAVRSLNFQDGDPIEEDDFVLTWPEVEFPTGTKKGYEVGLVVYGPSQMPVDHQFLFFSPNRPVDSHDSAIIAWATQEIETNSWPIAERGVGDMKLTPGNTYWVWVSALDESKNEIARYDGVRFWVPWKHRKTLPPRSITQDFPDVEYQPPMITYMEWSSSGNRIDMCEKFIKSFPDTFEYDYARLGWAWLIWHDGKKEESLAELEKLSEELPVGNVVQVTAAEFAEVLHRGEEMPQTFKLGGSMNMTRSYEEMRQRR